jgi:aminopeptidase N
MMRQLETIMGKTAFQSGIKDYIKQFANANADWSELVNILDKKTKIDVKKWSSIWVNSSGRPLISDKISYTNNVISDFNINQNAEDGSNKLWPQTFTLGLIYKDSIHSIPVNIKDKSTKITNAIGLPKPLAICYNYNGLGYGVFPIDKTMTSSISTLENPIARAYSYINLYENTLTGLITPNEALQVYITGIASEKNQHILSLISNYSSSLFWTFTTAKEQKENQIKIEKELIKRLVGDDNTNIKKTIFRLFKNIAYSENGIQKLHEIWSKKTHYNQLILNEDDYSSIAQTLALFNHPKSDSILTVAEKAITNPDKQKRFHFLRSALSQNDSIRNSFFISFKNIKNREKESWVTKANNFIHHPIHNQSASKTLLLSLELLEEIQRTGDIFFPKGWLASTIGNYNSKEAYTILNSFLENNPNFNPILKKKLLQTTDNLVRAQKILN